MPADDIDMESAMDHEATVAERLRQEGWAVTGEGQGIWDPSVVAALRGVATPVRFIPDLLAVRNDVVYYVDAKSGRTDTANWCIEKAALQSHENIYAAIRVPVVYVWADFRCNFHWDLMASDGLREGKWGGRGSGTPFWLWPRRYDRAFLDIFGAVAYGAQAYASAAGCACAFDAVEVTDPQFRLAYCPNCGAFKWNVA